MSIRNIIYYHQSLPLYHFRFNPFASGGKSLSFYSFVYPLYVKWLMNKQTYVAVQTETIRELFSKKYRFPMDQIGVYFPKVERIDADSVKAYDYEAGTINFIYPSMESAYKQHLTVVYAFERILAADETLAKRMRIHFTMQPEDNPRLYGYICKHQLEPYFVFHGNVPYQQVLSMMKSCHGLVFPSVVETLGLPLLEAASLGVPVIANDMGYAREVLSGYEGATLVKVRDYDQWAQAMQTYGSEKKSFTPKQYADDNSWGRLIRKITEGHRSQVVCVLATASAKRGALAMYNQFMQALAANQSNSEWHIFVDVDMPMPEMLCVHYHICHTKGFGRVWFDLKGFKQETRRLGIVPDVIFSLQNTGALY